MSKIALIIGYGSIGAKHARVLSTLNKFKKIYVFSSKKKIPYPRINKLSESIKLNPDYIVIATPSTKHYKYLDFFEKKFIVKLIKVFFLEIAFKHKMSSTLTFRLDIFLLNT